MGQGVSFTYDVHVKVAHRSTCIGHASSRAYCDHLERG